MTISLADWLQLGLLLLGLLVLGAGLLNRWAVANHKDRLAAYTSAAGNAAGRIRDALQALPAGATAADVKARLISTAAEDLMTEFDTTATKLGATSEKTEAIISGQLGQLTPPVEPKPVTDAPVPYGVPVVQPVTPAKA